MPIDVDTAQDVATMATNMNMTPAPMPGIPVSPGTLAAGQKSVAERHLKGARTGGEFDATDNDRCYLFELTKAAIENGADIEKIDLPALIPYFQEEKKQSTKKYTAQRITAFFTGGTFTFLIYLLFEFLKTMG